MNQVRFLLFYVTNHVINRFWSVNKFIIRCKFFHKSENMNVDAKFIMLKIFVYITFNNQFIR